MHARTLLAPHNQGDSHFVGRQLMFVGVNCGRTGVFSGVCVGVLSHTAEEFIL